MAGGLNDLELETEALEEINLSPQPAARPPPAVPARRARRIVCGGDASHGGGPAC